MHDFTTQLRKRIHAFHKTMRHPNNQNQTRYVRVSET